MKRRNIIYGRINVGNIKDSIQSQFTVAVLSKSIYKKHEINK